MKKSIKSLERKLVEKKQIFADLHKVFVELSKMKEEKLRRTENDILDQMITTL